MPDRRTCQIEKRTLKLAAALVLCWDTWSDETEAAHDREFKRLLELTDSHDCDRNRFADIRATGLSYEKNPKDLTICEALEPLRELIKV